MFRNILIAAVALAAGTMSFAHADIIVPGANTSKAGDGGQGFPFDVGPLPERLAQLYSASTLGAAPIKIYGLAFRPAAGSAAKAFSATLPSVTISLSTSPRKVGVGEDLTFADYIGTDVTTVRSGALALSSANHLLADGTKAFDIVIRFATPFAYDPTKGDLFVDIFNRNTGGPFTTYFDGISLGAPSIDQLFTYRGEPVTSKDGHLRAGRGLITKFLTTPVPEAGTLALLGAGLMVAAAGRRRR